MPALDLFWYDGGMKPRLPEEVEAHDVEMSREGILFVGDEGAILAGFHGQDPQLFAKGQSEPLPLDEAPAPRCRTRQSPRPVARAPAREASRRRAVSSTRQPITDAVNLGTVALRAGKKVLFDSEKMKITNAPDANRYLVREYRKGWEL